MSAPYHTQNCTGKDCHCMQDHLKWVDECESESPFDVVWFWGVVILATVCTLAVLLGVAGYFWGPR